jgi:hypothetical protein
VICCWSCSKLPAYFNVYLNKCLEIIAFFDDFTMQHVSRDENTVPNDLAQQASGLRSNRGKFCFLKKIDVLVCQTRQFTFRPRCSATICSAEPSSAKPNGPVLEIGGSKIFSILDESSKTTTANPDDWRTPWYVI